MSRELDRAFRSLNQQQKRAASTLEGPLLVIAGPGTGKTQLLSTRVANILRKLDITPSNILCLTFTDNAARNMRERLASMIGQPAYHIAIHTFHSFGSDIINKYPDCFTSRQLLQQVDELGRYELMQEIFENLPHGNPLNVKVGDSFVFLKNTLDVVSWMKQNAITPAGLHVLLAANYKFVEETAKQLADAFSESPLAKYLPAYNKFLKHIQKHATGKSHFGFHDLASECAAELELAIAQTDAGGRYAQAITAWRNSWCQKDASDNYVYKDGGQNYRKMQAVANAYQKLLDNMAEQGLYDFDDMVIEAVQAMENNAELRFNLQERYQYILVDEFQDTNKAQLRMLAALGDNPVHEGRPNIMAVGDDDQAIYAFQGAEASNMAAFVKMYDAKPIVLSQNYRSSANILETAEAIASQITDRLESVVPSVGKHLTANQKYDTDVLDHLKFPSELAQYDWVASEVEKLISGGTEPENIAIIAPRHRYLERMMPYLGERHIPVAYERRENILEAPLILQLTTMADLVVALSLNQQDDIDMLIGQVLGYDFWQLPPELVVGFSLECYKKHRHWLELLLSHKDKRLQAITKWFVRLSKQSRLEPMEYILDQLIGANEDEADSEHDELQPTRRKQAKFTSPFKAYYFSSERYEQATENYLTLLGQLATLRHRLRQWKPNRTLYVSDLAEFTSLHIAANLKIIDTNPHTQTTKAVQVMTVYKAKGLEFDAVFVINAQDEIWGPTARSQSSRISLPHNLPIAPAGESDNDKLRLLFVALTRARHTLHITSYSHNLDNKPSPELSFISEAPGVEPTTIDKPASVKAVEILATDWSYRFRQVIANKPELLEPILADYKLSVTHMNNFIDITGGGPQYFLVHNLLRFPMALAPSAAYGDAVHQTLKWARSELRASEKLPVTNKILDYFSDMLARKHLNKTDQKRLGERGRKALERYISARSGIFSPKDLVERGFNNDGVVVADARLSGTIDMIRFKSDNTVEVLDFKTGKPAHNWQGKDDYEKIKLHKYRQQLLFYKLLVEHSASFNKRVRVSGGALEFIEANEQDKLAENLELTYEQEEMDQLIKLIGAVWTHIMNLDFPDVSKYPSTLRGVQQFEQDLIDGRPNKK